MDSTTRETAVTRRSLLRTGVGAGAAATAAAGAGGVAVAETDDTEPATTDFSGQRAQTDEETAEGDGESNQESAADDTATWTLVAMLGLGLLSPVLFALLMKFRSAD